MLGIVSIKVEFPWDKALLRDLGAYQLSTGIDPTKFLPRLEAARIWWVSIEKLSWLVFLVDPHPSGKFEVAGTPG
ncbi:hypothetical protein DSO57_1008737 [Entomophthora muscae]|uniref:Uncharacterized protein n=1 Tax=Entomophthora muscae TaxID=34485 RepID=A0ACC2THZ7_9FUNG|nr:hypothetical protein DSO57_1008737 [Entomophthora muscae]